MRTALCASGREVAACQQRARRGGCSLPPKGAAAHQRLQPACRAAPLKSGAATTPTQGGVDLVLSSGFLAFANHSGFLHAVEETGLPVVGVMGTSAGALSGSLYCAGHSPGAVARHLSRDPPIALLRGSLSPWRGGVLALDGVVGRLRDLLPPRFEDLSIPLCVGVVDTHGNYTLIDSGPLPEAVAASAAIPVIFEPVDIPGRRSTNPYRDGGLVDRVGLRAWRDRRRARATSPPPPALVHVIARSSPFSGFDDVESQGEDRVVIVHSPPSGVSLFSLGDFEDDMAASAARSRRAFQAAAARAGLSSLAAVDAMSTVATAPLARSGAA